MSRNLWSFLSLLSLLSFLSLLSTPALADQKTTREIFVPFEDLNVLLEGQDQRVLLTRQEYEELLKKSQLAPAGDKSPQSRVVLSASYEGVVEEGRATIQAVLTLDVMTDELLAVPLGVHGVTLRSATLDGKPAPLGKGADGLPILFVQGTGRHELKLELIVPLQTAAAQQSLQFQLPFPASTQWRLTVPGNVDVKSGALVIHREVDATANVTRLELLPQREQTTIVMSLNNRVLLQQRVILARSVLIDELTQSYDKLHATVSLAIPHGAVDRFRFALPAGFEVTDVATPLLARWAVEKGEGDSRILDILLREATRDTVVVSIVAVNHAPQLEKWTMPQLRPLDVASHVAIVGLLAEERLTPTTLTPGSLIPIDTAVLNSALPASILQPEPGAPRLRPVAAYYSPQPDFQLQAGYRRSEPRVEVTSNLLFTLNDRQMQLRGGFALRPLVDPLFNAEIKIPANWQVTAVTQNDGTPLPFELFSGANNTMRLQVRLPHGAPPGQFFNLFVHAHTTPPGWLNEWSQTTLALPSFAISGATRDVGAVAVQTLDDLIARPEQLAGLTPLDEKEKTDFGLAQTPTSLAYRYESQPYSANLTIDRPLPRATARTFNFLRLEPEGLFAHYELLYQIDNARARRLTLLLPASTPDALAIRGLDVQVKEFRSEEVNGARQWVVELAEPRSGSVRLVVDFQQSLPAEIRNATQTSGSTKTTDITLPLVRAANVIYQSGTLAVEGDMEFDVEVKTDARRVDVGELVDAEYQVGKRLLGAFGFVGEPGVVLATIARRPEFGLPSAIVQRAELVTVLSAQGVAQTAARFHLRTKAPFLEVALPANSTLWSATIGGQPVAPQRDRDRLLVSLSSVGTDELRDLQLVYETPVAVWSRWGEVEADAPRLLLRDESGANRAEVPLADLQWHLVLPDGQRVVRSQGSVFTSEVKKQRSPLLVVVEKSSGSLRSIGIGLHSFHDTHRAWRTDERKSSIKSRDGSVDFSAMPTTAATPPPTAEPQAAKTDEMPKEQMEEFAEGLDRAPERARQFRAAGGMGGQMRDGTGQPGTSSGIPPTVPPVTAPAMPAAPAQPAATDQPAEQPPGATPQVAKPAEPAKPAKDRFWALQGVRSLPVQLAQIGPQVTFHSLGVQPRLQVTLANSRSLDFLAATLAIIVGILGLRLSVAASLRDASSDVALGSASRRDATTWRTKARFVILTGALLLAAPLVLGLFTDLELTHVFAPAFYVVCWLVIWYLFVGIATRLVRGTKRLFAGRRRPAAAAATTAVLLFAVIPAANAQESTTIETLRNLLAPSPPVKIPADAVVIPYNAEDPLGPKNATKVFVPYSEYVKLWNTAYPDKPLTAKTPATPFAIGGATYTSTLNGDEFLSVIGRMEIQTYSEGSHQIPLPLTDAVLTRVTVDGQPARMQVIQAAPPPAAQPPNPAPNAPAQQATAPVQPPPSESIPAVLVEGVGRKQLEFELRFKLTRSGGWRIVAGRVPVAAATALDLVVPSAKTEVRVGGSADGSQIGEFETQQDQQTIHTAIAPDGQLRLQWRPKIAEAQVDQSLTARSTAVLDIQEDAVRLTWQTDLTFRRGLRDTFTFSVPADMLLEKVIGNNVRGWKTTTEGDTSKVDVTLLKSATGGEKLTLLLSKRAAVGEGAMAAFAAPAVTVVDAALHQGILVVRRSPMLEVRVDNATGLNRADANEQEVAAVLANVTDDSPLGVRVFQTYRFASTPFTLRMMALPYAATTTVEVQSLLRIADRENRYEGRLNFTVDNRPRFSIQCRLPVGLLVDDVTGSTKLDWTTNTVEQREVLSVFLPAGQQQFSIVIRGRLPRTNADGFAAPRIEVLDVNRQTGHLVVQADPAYDVRAEQLQGCENVLLEQVFGWLNEGQRRLARFALAYRSPDFAATLRVIARQPRVRSFSITNSRITPFAVEDTVYLQFSIADAGIRTVTFHLPAEMRDARITAPLLRQKTFEPVADEPNRVRVKLELQDEVTDQLIVVVEHDRALTGESFESPIPVVETGTTEHRFVVLENVGRDEVVVAAADQMTELNRQQSQWTKLAETLGDKIMRAYVVREDAVQPRLQIQTKRRATVETAGARIGLAKTLLVVDSHGAYRGIQEYWIDNKTEQYLEIELPSGAELWTARVAGEPVKPVTATGAGTTSVFIPLTKTAAGDLDYAVELKYGGRIEMPRGPGKVSFPLMHTKNIRVELSQVRLRLPETRRWLDFGGSMRYIRAEAELQAGFKTYQSKQLEQLLNVAQEGESFSKVRATNNLKQLKLSIESANRSEQQHLWNSDFQREFNNNTALLQQADQVLQQQAQAAPESAAGDNRSVLLFKCNTQPLTRSKNVVTQLDANFDDSINGVVDSRSDRSGPESGKDIQRFNLNWLDGNRLKVDEATREKKDGKSQSRVDFDGDQSKTPEGKPAAKGEAAQAAGSLGRKLAEDSARETSKVAQSEVAESKAIERDNQRAGELNKQVERYQQRLEQQQQQTLNAPAPAVTAAARNANAGLLQQTAETSKLSAELEEAQRRALGVVQAGESARPVSVSGLASLDVVIPERGVEYRFVTPRGEIAIDAWMIETNQSHRLLSLLALCGGLGLIWFAPRLGRKFRRRPRG